MDYILVNIIAEYAIGIVVSKELSNFADKI
jgi:hypothetical protein